MIKLLSGSTMRQLACQRVRRPALYLVFGVLLPAFAFEAEAQATPSYVGSEECAGCHEAVGLAWRQSHHALAWTPARPDTIVADFDGTDFSGGGVEAQFNIGEGGTYDITVTEADGDTRSYEVHSVVGIEPLQQYLLETAPGRLQSFDIVWDVEKERWYHLYPGQDLPPDDGLHWTGPYKNWNGRCAECHATGFKKNYNPRTRGFASTQAEIGVGCEACHGPGSEHVDWAEGQGLAEDANDLGPKGFSASFDETEKTIQQCAGCHSRREALGDGNPLPGTLYHDAYNLALLRPGLYHADGQIQDEVYVYGSFLQSKMYARGVGCLNCHDAHTAELVADGNAVCTQCHSPAGNPAFPTLSGFEYDSAAHHFHAPGGAGAECKNCHMIERTYMGIDGRRDHSFRIPRPDLAPITGGPDACTDCHNDRDPAWAAARVAEWFPESRNRGPHFGMVLARGRTDPVAETGDLLALAADEGQPGIVRATAMWLLEIASDGAAASALVPLLTDSDPVVRAAAVRLQRIVPHRERVARLAGVLNDPVRTVRIAAAQALLDVSSAGLGDGNTAALRAALDDWQRAIRNRLDFPETHLQNAGLALTQRNVPAAVRAFREVVTLDPQRVEAWSMLVRLAAATRGAEGARAVLDEALALNPEDEELRSYDREIP